MPLYVKLLSDHATRPVADPRGAGFLLAAEEETDLYEFGRAWIPTGLALAIAPGYVGLLLPLGGGLSELDISPSIIDSVDRTELKVMVKNFSPHRQTVKRGAFVARLLIIPSGRPALLEVDALPAVPDRLGLGTTSP
jgi:dUTP pyrophosphatase